MAGILATIVITGAAGNIGGKIRDDLLSRGQKIRYIVKNVVELDELAGKGTEIADGSFEDAAFPTKAFSGADAVFAMIPPNYTAPDLRAYQNSIGASIAEAIGTFGVKYIVDLSSHGAHLPEKTGPIKGLRDQEERLINSGESTACICVRHSMDFHSQRSH